MQGEVRAELLHGGVKRLDRAERAREHHAALHRGEHEGSERAGVRTAGQARTELLNAALDGLHPSGEVFRDEGVCRTVFRVDLERQPSQRTAIAAPGGENAAAVALQNGEDAGNGVVAAGQGRVDDDGVKSAEIHGQHFAQECLFAVEEMVEAA